MSKFYFIVGLIILMIAETYLRLVFSGWPFVLVPVLLIFFVVCDMRNQGNLSLAIVASIAHDLFIGGVPGVSVATLSAVLLLYYFLSMRIELSDGFLSVNLATLVGLVIYLEAMYLFDGILLNKTVSDFVLTTQPTLGFLAVALVEACILLLIIVGLRLLGTYRKRRRFSFN